MTIEERLNKTIEFVLNNPQSTEQEYLDYMAGLGDTGTQTALTTYLDLLYNFGYITEKTYTAMRDWGNAIPLTALGTAKATLLEEYYKLQQQEDEKNELINELDELNNIKTEIANASTLPQLDNYYTDGTKYYHVSVREIDINKVDKRISEIEKLLQ